MKTEPGLSTDTEDSKILSDYRLLGIYAWYRFLLALLMLAMFFIIYGQRLLLGFDPALYLGTTCGYAVANLLLLLLIRKPRGRMRPRSYFAIFVIDIAALVLVTHASGGISSGFSILLVVTTAAAAVFLPGQIAVLVAAVATIGVLSESVLSILSFRTTVGSLLPAGLLGMLLFVTAIIVQGVARRMRVSEEIAELKTEEVFSLQQLNQLIVQRMHTGILVVDKACRVQLTNAAAKRLLEVDHPDALPAPLMAALEGWRRGVKTSGKPIRLRESGPAMQASFATLQHPSGDGTLLFLEDFARISQQAQQLKLASLGRLTASIAHEIRNPLGAISHAAQLLHEEDALTDSDQQLVEIILNHGQRMNEVIESVLYLSRGHQPHPKRLALAPWLADFIANFHYQDGEGNASAFEIECDIAETQVSMDPGHLRQVLTNLCQNGLRYSERATGKARITLLVRADSDDQHAILDVIDYGPGIGDEDAVHVFEPFFTTERTGTGLGLYLARELCEANQSRLDYLRNSNSCFRISFSDPDRRELDEEIGGEA